MKTYRKGIISAGHHETATAGAEILRAGGNAYDAAIGAMLAAFTAESSAAISAGGGGFLLAHTAKQESILFDFFVQTPSSKRLFTTQPDFHKITINFGTATQDFHVGLASMAVHGNFAGAFHVHQRLGKMPFDEVIQPAIDLAKKGVIVSEYQSKASKFLTPILEDSAENRFIFIENGKLKEQGQKIIVTDLADSLFLLGKEGTDEFYKGEIAGRLANDCAERGGFISRQDLENYRVIERKPLAINYRNHTLFTNPPPSSGGSLIAFTLQLLEKYNVQDIAKDKKAYTRLLCDVMQLTDKARQKEFDAYIYKQGLAEHFLAAENMSPYHTMLKNNLLGSTTQISVLDAEGNAASLTLSSGVGTSYYIPNTGIMMNNMLGEADLNPNGFHQWPTNRRISSMMSPSVILNDLGAKTVVGSSGSSRIRTAILQTLLNFIDLKMPIEQAVDASRVHIDSDVLHLEYGFAKNDLLQHLNLPNGVKAKLGNEKSMYFGGVNAVMLDEKKQYTGAADQRRKGSVIFC
ncbi:MAG: gamma-glutamyltransferase [Chitinophagales bacterium]